MRKIIKGGEPASLTRWKRANPTKKYADLTGTLRQDIREVMIEEQHHICAYCCQSVTLDKAKNEHIEPQSRAPNKTLDFNNIVASCDSRNRCDHAHRSKHLPLTPLMEACETELDFRLSGRVRGKTDRAKVTIQVLNLGDKNESNQGLIRQRKSAIDGLLFSQGADPSTIETEDNELLELLLEDLSKPDTENKILPFAPVLLNILKGYLEN